MTATVKSLRTRDSSLLAGLTPTPSGHSRETFSGYPGCMTNRMLDAVTDPCQLRKMHVPEPIRTQSHHRFPEYLQRRLWGEVRLQERLALCGTDHDSLHTWIAVLLGEQAWPQKDPGFLVRAEATRVVAWYRAERERLPLGFGEGAYGAGELGGRRDEWDGVE